MLKKKWWKEGIVYQIYPRSFHDSNGDGIGDLRGIIEKLDYIKELGVNIIWLNPVYKSPNDDMGYDISDYQDIMDEFGTLRDWEELLEGLHKRGIKLIMDLVVNHTSDEHKWFVESKKSKDNKYRDYYIWKSAEAGVPNNWGSYFEGSAWELDEPSNEYYLHLFSRKQPDLNWENEQVRKEIYDMMTWWLEKGIDGFRMDVINHLAKHPDYPDGIVNKGTYAYSSHQYINQPKVHDYLKEMNEHVLSKYDIMTVGECVAVSPEQGLKYVHEDRHELNMIFQFEHMELGGGRHTWQKHDWKLTDLKKIVMKWTGVIEAGGWSSNYLMNHDQPRAVSRFGNDREYRKESAKMLGMFNITLPGTPYVYQGEEIGMTNSTFNDISEFRDLESINMYHVEIGNKTEEELLEILNVFSRDHSRTPMQWNGDVNAGFTTGTPWIKLNPNYREINVEESLADENSIFKFYQKLIGLRKSIAALSYGSFEMLVEESENIFAFTRSLNDEKYLIVLNFSGEKMENEVDIQSSELLLSNYNDKPSKDLRPYEAMLLKMQ